jgi:hypothetical protein
MLARESAHNHIWSDKYIRWSGAGRTSLNFRVNLFERYMTCAVLKVAFVLEVALLKKLQEIKVVELSMPEKAKFNEVINTIEVYKKMPDSRFKYPHGRSAYLYFLRDDMHTFLGLIKSINCNREI